MEACGSSSRIRIPSSSQIWNPSSTRLKWTIELAQTRVDSNSRFKSTWIQVKDRIQKAVKNEFWKISNWRTRQKLVDLLRSIEGKWEIRVDLLVSMGGAMDHQIYGVEGNGARRGVWFGRGKRWKQVGFSKVFQKKTSDSVFRHSKWVIGPGYMHQRMIHATSTIGWHRMAF